MQQHIEELKASLRDALYLDLDEYALEALENELVSTFVGIRLKSAFQPVVERTSGKVLGYEALLRPSLGDVQSVTPEFAFSFADQSGKLVKLDRVCRVLHMLNYLTLPEEKGLLFLNVHPKLLISVNAHGRVFERVLHAHSVPTFRVVIEVLENAVEIDKHLADAIGNYKDRGYQIAIDDFGSNHSNIDRLWHLSPDYVKLDRSLIHEAEHNKKVARILPKLVDIVHELGAKSVIEGIENDVQYQLALDSGADALQGYLLGRPLPARHWLAHHGEATAKAA